jgi:hypothetical protein
MAGSTVSGCHRVIHVLFCKRHFIGLVALPTKGRRIPSQQKIGFGRCMRIMAIEATFPLVYGLVPELNLAELSVHIFMAIKTEFIA